MKKKEKEKEREREEKKNSFRSMANSIVPAAAADVEKNETQPQPKNQKTEEDAASWQEAVHLSALSPRYRSALEGAATALRTAVAAVAASRGGAGGGGGGRRRTDGASASASASASTPSSSSAGSALVLNLGPAWSSASAYALFDDAVIELPFRDWEGPPGLCTPPLDVLFAVAEATSKWLSTSPEAVALLCVRARSGGGAATARLVAACHSVYNVDARTVAEALRALPPPPPRARGWSTFFAPPAAKKKQASVIFEEFQKVIVSFAPTKV